MWHPRKVVVLQKYTWEAYDLSCSVQDDLISAFALCCYGVSCSLISYDDSGES